MKPPKIVNHSREIQDLISIEISPFRDFRGMNFEIFDSNKPNINIPFSLDSCSVSTKSVLRGFHGDKCNWKIIQCLYGTIQFFVIDMRRRSPTYKKSKEFILNGDSPLQIVVPAGVVNAHLCLSDSCVFYYKWSDGYVPIFKQIHIKWNDPRFNIKWKTSNPILSKRDS